MNNRSYGVFDIEYHEGREKNKVLKYRLYRRTLEVIQAIRKYHPNNINSILDIGTADGLMLSRIKEKFPAIKCVGVEYSPDLIAANEDKAIQIVQGDGQNLPFEENSFDIAIATALIEHVPEPPKLLRETHRILVKGGMLVVTTPDPFWHHIGTVLGHLDKQQYCKSMSLKELQDILRQAGFKVLQADKFMLSPIGMPFELKIERGVKKLKLRFLFANQLVVGIKKL